MIVRCCPLRYITQDVWELVEDVALAKGQLQVRERHQLPVPYHQAFMAAWSERRIRQAAEAAKRRRKK